MKEMDGSFCVWFRETVNQKYPECTFTGKFEFVKVTNTMVEQKNEFTIKPYFSQFNFTESWLQDQARQGLILKDYDMGRYTFKAGDASTRRYRVMPVGLFRRRKEIKKWESAGWMRKES